MDLVENSPCRRATSSPRLGRCRCGTGGDVGSIVDKHPGPIAKNSGRIRQRPQYFAGDGLWADAVWEDCSTRFNPGAAN